MTLLNCQALALDSQAGAGNDTVTILQGLAGDTEIYLGGGNDALTISGIGGYLAGTIFGGAGATPSALVFPVATTLFRWIDLRLQRLL